MSNRRISTMDIMELVRLLRTGASDRTLTHLRGHNRRTVAKYRQWAQEQGVLSGPPLDGQTLHALLARTLPVPTPPQQTSTLAPYRDEVAAYRARGMEMAAIRGRLEEQHGHPVSYAAVRRLVQTLEPARVDAVVRVEVAPGSEAQVDFGYAGLTLDPQTGQPRKTWVFVLLLSWSRHLYAELVYDQSVETWLLAHRHAFEAWGGVPGRIVPDNLKAAIVRAGFTEPLAQRAYRECATHYGFLIDPHPPRMPQHKGKVEGGVHSVKRNFLAGRDPAPTDLLNRLLAQWCRETAGQRIHGTTKTPPLERFTTVEQAALRPLPATPYDLAVWAAATVGRDCPVVCAGSFYSAPFRLGGQQVLLRRGARTLEIYDAAHALIATHDRATHPGDRQTQLVHLPPEKIPNLVLTRADCLHQAQAIGPATAAVVQTLLDHRPEDRLRSAGRVVRLAQRTTPARLERAGARALAFGITDYPRIKDILQSGLAETALPAASPVETTPRVYAFARQASEFAASLLGGRR